MPIRYALYENNITSDPDDYAAIVQIAGSLDLEGLADRMIAQGLSIADFGFGIADLRS